MTDIKKEPLDAELISLLSGAEVSVMDETASTNSVAKELATAGAPAGTVVMAERQSAGRGQRGRSFVSVGEGIYLSAILRPESEPSRTPLITAAAGVAVRDAIESVCGKNCLIKWVNDIVLNGKKLCGILAEAVTNPQNGKITAVVVGIGINFRGNVSMLPKELKDTVGFVFEDGEAAATRSILAAEVIKRLYALTGGLEDRAFLRSYRAHSSVLGKRVQFTRGGRVRSAIATDIDDNCALVLRYDDGSVESVAAGEVSVKSD